jgi:transketolase
MKPLDEQKIRNAIEKRAPILTLEEHSMIGGLGSAVADVIAQSGRGVKFKKIALPDDYCHRVGSQDVLRKHYGLDVEGLQKQVLEFLGSEI